MSTTLQSQIDMARLSFKSIAAALIPQGLIPVMEFGVVACAFNYTREFSLYTQQRHHPQPTFRPKAIHPIRYFS
jgi:hypothetical protein